MVALVQAGQKCVKFHGERDDTAPLTLGQRNTWQWVANKDFGLYSTEQWVFDVPDGATPDDVAETFGVLIARHESLRTTYPVQAGEVVQRIVGSGELDIEVFDVGEQDPGLAEVAQELVRRLRERPFDLASQLPMRAAMAIGPSGVTAVVMVCSHMAVDFGAMAVVGRQFAELVADPVARVVGERGHQPLDQAVFEGSERGRRLADAALRYWREGLSQRPQCLYAAPVAGADGGPRAAILRSAAAAIALPHVTGRTGASAPMVTLAAVCAVLARRGGQRHTTVSSLSSNRFAGHLRDYVGTLAQDGLVRVDTQVAGFDELVRRAGTAALRASRHSMFDAHRLQEIHDEVGHQRGLCFFRDCAVDNLMSHVFGPDQARPAGSPADAAAALTQSAMLWREPPGMSEYLRFQFIDIGSALALRLWAADTGRVPAVEMEGLLRGVERLVVAAAAGDVELSRLGEVCGVEPLARGDGWLYLDWCWVEVAEVRRLVADALPGAVSGVFAVPGADGRPGLVAYLAGADGLSTAQQAHAACMAVLRGRYTAVAPGRYVICDRAPGDPADLAGWQHQTVIADGDGRARPRRQPTTG